MRRRATQAGIVSWPRSGPRPSTASHPPRSTRDCLRTPAGDAREQTESLPAGTIARVRQSSGLSARERGERCRGPGRWSWRTLPMGWREHCRWAIVQRVSSGHLNCAGANSSARASESPGQSRVSPRVRNAVRDVEASAYTACLRSRSYCEPLVSHRSKAVGRRSAHLS